jgi:hypothetical protein
VLLRQLLLSLYCVAVMHVFGVCLCGPTSLVSACGSLIDICFAGAESHCLALFEQVMCKIEAGYFEVPSLIFIPPMIHNCLLEQYIRTPLAFTLMI